MQVAPIDRIGSDQTPWVEALEFDVQAASELHHMALLMEPASYEEAKARI